MFGAPQGKRALVPVQIPLDVEAVNRAELKTRTVALVDLSLSMSSVLPEVKLILQALLEQLDEVAIIGFSETPVKLTDGMVDASSVKLRDLQEVGATNITKAYHDAHLLLEAIPDEQGYTKSIYIITDGAFTDCGAFLHLVNHKLDENVVPVHCVPFGKGVDMATLKRVSAITGGMTVSTVATDDVASMNDALAKIVHRCDKALVCNRALCTLTMNPSLFKQGARFIQPVETDTESADFDDDDVEVAKIVHAIDRRGCMYKDEQYEVFTAVYLPPATAQSDGELAKLRVAYYHDSHLVHTHELDIPLPDKVVDRESQSERMKVNAKWAFERVEGMMIKDFRNRSIAPRAQNVLERFEQHLDEHQAAMLHSMGTSICPEQTSQVAEQHHSMPVINGTTTLIEKQASERMHFLSQPA